jgi:hypothetical protein
MGHQDTRRIFPGTFMLRDEVFHRAGRARLPIEPLYGPNLACEAAYLQDRCRGGAAEAARSRDRENRSQGRARHQRGRVGGELPFKHRVGPARTAKIAPDEPVRYPTLV